VNPNARPGGLFALCACARRSHATACRVRGPHQRPTRIRDIAQTGALPAPATAAQNETQQATASQESVDTEGERPARSDTSLEQIAELPAGAKLPTANGSRA